MEPVLCDTKYPVRQEVLQRLAAGIVTPALAMLFFQIGQLLYQLDGRSLQPWFLKSFLLELPIAAAILGAPFGISAALLIRLPHLWLCVPLISLVAAVGIEAQVYSSGMLEDSQFFVVLMFVWVLPALFGTGAALLLQRRPSLWALAVPLAVILALPLATHGVARARAIAPAIAAARHWSVLRVGMAVYTGGDASDGQTVCASIAALLEAKKGGGTRCTTIPGGVAATVDAVIPCRKTDPDWGFGSPRVRIHARDRSWWGFADAGSLQPSIPTGTLLSMQRDWGAPLTLYDDRGNRTTIGDAALARLLRYAPKRDASLYVQILDGAYRNRRGWMSIQAVDTGGVSLGEYGIEYPYHACAP